MVARDLPTDCETDACRPVGFFSSARLVFTDFHMAKTSRLGICCGATLKRNRRKKEVSEEDCAKQLWPCIISVMLRHNYLGCICKDD